MEVKYYQYCPLHLQQIHIASRTMQGCLYCKIFLSFQLHQKKQVIHHPFPPEFTCRIMSRRSNPGIISFGAENIIQDLLLNLPSVGLHCSNDGKKGEENHSYQRALTHWGAISDINREEYLKHCSISVLGWRFKFTALFLFLKILAKIVFIESSSLTEKIVIDLII